MSIQEAHAWLEQARNPDGSWGYLAGQAGRGEPTVLASAAGLPAPLDWLRTADLGFAILLVPAALSADPAAADFRKATTKRILKMHSAHIDASGGKYLAQDVTIPGWSWYPHTAAWVEPTAYAVISLKKMRLRDDERVQEGDALLRDRQCDDGGWNYGNPQIFDQRLTGFPGPTAWAVMALDPSPAVDRGLARLDHVRQEVSGQSLSLAILARVAHGRAAQDLPDLLLPRQRPDGSFNARVDTTALAVLALRAAVEGTHVFDLTP